MLMTKKRRATVLDATRERIRKTFRDAEEAALNQLGESGIQPGSEDLGDDSDSDGDSHTHIHIHAGGDAPTGAAPAPKAAGTDEALEGEVDPNAVKTEDDPNEARFKALEDGHAAILAQLAAISKQLGGTGDADEDEVDPPADDITAKDGMPEEVEEALKGKTGDSVALETSFKAVLADAEILVPGYRFPTFDAKKPRKGTMDAMCQLRRGVLGHLASTTEGASFLASANGGAAPDLAGGSCASTASLFRAAAGAKRIINNKAGTGDAQRLPNGTLRVQHAPVKSIADLNKINAEFHAAKQRAH